MDDRLFEQIYVQYNSLIYNYLYRSTLNHHTAEELTQETFLKAFRSIYRFRKQSSLKTWLFTIARNGYLDHMKKKQSAEKIIDPTKTSFVDQSDIFSSFNEKMLIRHILLKVSEKDRTLIILRDQSGFAYHEIAKIMGMTEGQVKIGLYRARKKFKDLYQRESEVDQL